ncbi:MAG: site-specific DNA-methyltransferase [Gammaproteobacteria bacterium]|nr:MAG: site-specific DNA-methyltransferase [Gammaproteobacteria bacterium]
MTTSAPQRITASDIPEELSFDSILLGCAQSVLPRLPPACVDCIVTSPPYFGQRDYGVAGQIGTEETPEEYIERLTLIFREAKRLLKPAGSLWLNLGDKYDSLHMLGLPWRVALSLKADGWILRSDIIWHKPNAMPASTKNRPTTDHEYVFFFTKSGDYYYDSDSIREPHVTFTDRSRMRGGRNHFGKPGGTPEAGKNRGNNNLHRGRWDQAFHELGRNKRTVWSVPLSKSRDAHFAVFPEKLIEPCILAGCPEGGVVLDPFLGSGTTAVVALANRRRFLGVELNPAYREIAQKRLTGISRALL